jgi:tetratricopeptide (TPR) repeat protein
LGIVADKARDNDFRSAIADCWGLLADKSGLKYHARYEQAVQLLYADQKAAAREKFQKLFDETFAKGILPPIDHRFREAFGSDAWTKHVHDTVAKCLEKKYRSAVVLLAWQCRQLGDPALADDLLERAMKDPADDAERVSVTLAAIEYLWNIQSFEHADRLVGTLAAMPELQKQPRLWRLAAKVAEKRGRTKQQFECFEMALDREYAKMPEVFSIEPVRNDYRSLLNHYQWLAEASRSLDVGPPTDLLSRTIKAADRWRSLDPEVTEACDTTAKILRLVGGKEAEALAWDYLTTPLALKPNESDPWLGLATSATREGNLDLADRCYEAAFAAEPTNAQILWDRAKLLERRGEIARSRELMTQLSITEWQPRFEGLKSQAKWTLQGK